MKTNDLKTSLRTELLKFADRVFEYSRVPKGAEFPYVTYNMIAPVGSERDAIQDFDYVLEVEVFDKRQDKDTTILEDLTDTVFNGINRLDVIDTEFFYRIENSGVLTQLPTVDEFTFRRQISAALRYMERS